MQLGDDTQAGDISARDVARTLQNVYVQASDNALLLREVLRRLLHLERSGAVRQHLIAANAVATLAIIVVLWRNHRANVRGVLARRENRAT